jgi:peptidoglycan-associated lipoprotein
MKSFLRIALRIGLLALIAFSSTACRKKNPNALSDNTLGGIDGPGIGGIPVDGEFPMGSGERVGFEGRTPIDSSAFAAVYFAFDSSAIASGEFFKVQAVADYLQSNSGDVVAIQGHTDERGSREYNLSLGERRALAVREALITLGISADRIQTLSYGEEQPDAAGSGEAVWSVNRRAEFQLMR